MFFTKSSSLHLEHRTGTTSRLSYMTHSGTWSVSRLCFHFQAQFRWLRKTHTSVPMAGFEPVTSVVRDIDPDYYTTGRQRRFLAILNCHQTSDKTGEPSKAMLLTPWCLDRDFVSFTVFPLKRPSIVIHRYEKEFNLRNLIFFLRTMYWYVIQLLSSIIDEKIAAQ